MLRPYIDHGRAWEPSRQTPHFACSAPHSRSSRSRHAGAGSRDDQSLVESVSLRTIRLACHEARATRWTERSACHLNSVRTPLAVRLEQGARDLAGFASTLT